MCRQYATLHTAHFLKLEAKRRRRRRSSHQHPLLLSSSSMLQFCCSSVLSICSETDQCSTRGLP